eukprot:m.441666 g.441666  ORF g.441666 m.441666 type:complete len:63 (-) comp56801_c0_seq16:1695-1883(-)
MVLWTRIERNLYQEKPSVQAIELYLPSIVVEGLTSTSVRTLSWGRLVDFQPDKLLSAGSTNK